MEKKYLSQILATDDKYALFNKAGLNLGVAPTGAGKTYFIIDEMKKEFETTEGPFGLRQTLLLVNRSSLLEQYLTSIDEKFAESFDKDGYYLYRKCVHVMTYQRAFKMIAKDPLFLYKFNLLLMDEAHYFLQDSWNGTTDRVFNAIMERSKSIPCTMFTATPEELIHYTQVRKIDMKTIDYSAQLKHDRITCVATNKNFRDIINSIPIGDKYILFVNHKFSKKQIKQLAEELSTDSRCVGFYYSQWNKLGKQVIRDALMSEKYKNLVKLHKFEEDGAIANSAVDNGVDFKDEALKHIILLDHYDPVTMKQMIGRKRFNFDNPNDKLTAWVINTDRDFLSQEREKALEQITMYRGYKSLNAGDFIEKYADRLKHVRFHSSLDNLVANGIKTTSETLVNDEIVPCVSVEMKRAENNYFVPMFTVNFCLVAKSDYRLNYLNFLLDAKVQYNNNKAQPMALHKVMQQQLEDMGFGNVFIDHKNTYHDQLAKKQEQIKNAEYHLIPFLEGQLGKSMDKQTFDEFREFMFKTFGWKTEKRKVPGKKVIEELLKENGFSLISRLTRVDGEQIRLYSIIQ